MRLRNDAAGGDIGPVWPAAYAASPSSSPDELSALLELDVGSTGADCINDDGLDASQSLLLLTGDDVGGLEAVMLAPLGTVAAADEARSPRGASRNLARTDCISCSEILRLDTQPLAAARALLELPPGPAGSSASSSLSSSLAASGALSTARSVPIVTEEPSRRIGSGRTKVDEGAVGAGPVGEVERLAATAALEVLLVGVSCADDVGLVELLGEMAV